MQPSDNELRAGGLYYGLLTTLHTQSGAWIHGSFASLSSQNTLPLPEEKEDKLHRSRTANDIARFQETLRRMADTMTLEELLELEFEELHL